MNLVITPWPTEISPKRDRVHRDVIRSISCQNGQSY